MDKPLNDIVSASVNGSYLAKLRMLFYVHMMICVILYALSCVADIV